jgi:hypothetical protein
MPPAASTVQANIEDMNMANEGYHGPIEELSNETRNMHRAITSSPWSSYCN